MNKILLEEDKIIVIGNGLFSKDEVIVEIKKGKINSGIVFIIENERINASIQNVSNAIRNTVLSSENGKSSICLIEHFLSACSILDITDIEIRTNKNELVIGDGSALHWIEAFEKGGFITRDAINRISLPEPIFIKKGNKEILAIPHNGFKVSYSMDHPHPAIGKLWASYSSEENPDKILRARTFGTKEENDYFQVSGRILTLTEDSFNKPLHEPLEPAYHKILDIIGDLRLCGINPLKINMHVIGFRTGHEMNVELAKAINNTLLENSKL